MKKHVSTPHIKTSMDGQSFFQQVVNSEQNAKNQHQCVLRLNAYTIKTKK